MKEVSDMGVRIRVVLTLLILVGMFILFLMIPVISKR